MQKQKLCCLSTRVDVVDLEFSSDAARLKALWGAWALIACLRYGAHRSVRLSRARKAWLANDI